MLKRPTSARSSGLSLPLVFRRFLVLAVVGAVLSLLLLPSDRSLSLEANAASEDPIGSLIRRFKPWSRSTRCSGKSLCQGRSTRTPSRRWAVR